MVVKINVSLPEEVLERIDLAARESRATRSAFLVQAAERYLAEQEEERRQRRRREAAERILKLADELGPWDGTAEVLKWRDRH
ncbi:MAG: type II toxin-antitoxin system HicB family antitoxin [Dehalococcoidia bacterium]|nr:type II toxin-antitoxin system HicB family antitoxin [Dehalococcoidia bacterium]